MNAKLLFRFILMGLMLSALVLAGCDDGDDGRDGADGASAYEIAVENGFDGTEQEWLDSLQGEDATSTGESCNTCHGVNSSIGLNIDENHPLVDPKIVIYNVVVASGAGATDTVTFLAKDEKDDPVLGLTLDDFRFYIADLVPPLPYKSELVEYEPYRYNFQPERWLYERSGEDRDGVPYPNSEFIENGSGSYTYTFAVDLALGDLDRAPEFSIEHDQRLLIRARGDGIDDNDLSREAAIVDFLIPADGANTGVLSQDENDFERSVVVQEACTQCHGDPLQRASHGSSYQTPQGCVICHTPIGNDYGELMVEDGAWLAFLIHNIHAANSDRTAWDWSEITYPQEIAECEKCHFDAGQLQADNWKTNPTVEVCTSCHDVDFTTGDGHGENNIGGPQVNGDCTLCHPADTGGVGGSVAESHKVDYDADNLLYETTISLSPDADNNGVYEVGETILVTTTVDYPDFDYLNEDTAFLREATLYVYGPRALAVPVLTPGSTTDPDYVDPEVTPPGTPPDQGRGMLITAQADDPLVMTDASGFKYQLLEIAEDMDDGTYLIQSKIDFSEIGDRTTDGRHIGPRYYPLDGWQLVTFQVGEAEEEDKVAGECTGCHEQRNFSTYAHRSYFGTDGCLACHDQSGNHADPLTNRVHAVHAANTEGDLTNVPGEDPSRVWDEITFPRTLNQSCDACHNSGNNGYRAEPNGSWGFACYGCHAGQDGIREHMEQSGAPFPEH